ncbi:MAG: hypothetical protein R2784_20490 [Saprospiraceae bacterium]
MNVQLVPVVEIEFEFEDLEAPEVYPNAENAPIWDAYRQKCLQKAGFEGKITPFFPGATLYSLDALSDENLAKLIKIHTSEFRDGEYDRGNLRIVWRFCFESGWRRQVLSSVLW